MSARRGRRRSVGSVIPHRGRLDEWLVTLSLGFDRNGKRRRVVKVVHGTEADADRELARMLVARRHAVPIEDPGRLSLDQYLTEHWLPSKQGKIKQGTVEDYAGIVRKHISGRAIGRMRLSKVSPIAIERWFAELREDEARGEKTIHNAFSVLRQAMRQAVRWRLLDYDPTGAVEPPRYEKFRAHKLTAPEARTLLEAVAGEPIEVPVVLALGAGLRRGEVFGLHWTDVDLDAAEARIEWSLSRVKTGLVLNRPKTDRSRRVVPLPAPCLALLREHRRRQLKARLAAGDRWVDNDLVFTNRLGAPCDPAETSRMFKRAVARAGLPRLRFHDLRHGFASLLLSDGEDLGVISDLLGHSTIAITKDLYAEASREAKRRAVGRLDRVLGEQP